MRQGFRYLPPPITTLISLGNEHLCDVAQNIAKYHFVKQKSLSPELATEYCHARHEYGIAIKQSSRHTLDGIMMRLRSEVFWREQINQLADEHREHHAMRDKLLGDPKHGLMPYCSDQTVKLFEERRASIHAKMRRSPASPSSKVTKSDIYANSERSRLNQLYLTVKAMERLAVSREYIWIMITLTCPPRFHPSSKSYDGSSLREGNDFLNRLYRKLFKFLGKKYHANSDYFGLRVTEVHQDGCPHWHVLFYCSEKILTDLQCKLEQLLSGDGRPEGYYKTYSDKILKIQAAPGNENSPIGYVLKYLFRRSTGNASTIDTKTAMRVSYALRAAGVRQYQLIGAEGITTKARALRKVANDPTAPANLKELATTLVGNPADDGVRSLQGMVDLLDHSSRDVKFIREPCLNRFREPTSRLSHLKHHKDERRYEVRHAVMITRCPAAVTIKVSSKKNGYGQTLNSLSTHTNCHYSLPEQLQSIELCSPYLEYPPALLRWRPPWVTAKDPSPVILATRSFPMDVTKDRLARMNLDQHHNF